VLLNTVPKEVRAAVRPALDEAGDWMREKMADAAPPLSDRHPGVHVADIAYSVKITNEQASVAVGPNKNAYWAAFVEFGHRIIKRRKTGREVVANVPPRPFIRNTFDQYAEGWLEVFVEKLRAKLGL
jgi:HK97 gp10 family phage protein